jgi:sugar phosphate isomerase/epimerase
MEIDLSRRELLASASTALGVGLAAPLLAPQAAAKEPPTKDPFRYCLNTSTIRGQKLSLVEEVEIAAKAGYNGFEPWINELDRYKKNGGSLKDVGKRIRDRGLSVEDAIGFCPWIVDNASQRKKGLEEARRNMDLVQQIGGKRLAAPPVGATEQAGLNLYKAAERYRALLEVGARIGVVPMVELWGFSRSLSRLGETALVAIESGHPQACILVDVYHLYKGGSGFTDLKLLGAPALQIFHMNDYPARPPRARITDAHRVYPGDGVAPLKGLLRDLHRLGFAGMLSLELFNADYWKQDALKVAQTGLRKMRALARSSLK